MRFFHIPKNLISEYLPRDRLWMVGAIGTLLVMTWFFSPDKPITDGLNQVAVLTDPDPVVENEYNDAMQYGGIPAGDIVVGPSLPMWTHLEVKSGDNLSSLFIKVGLSAQDLYKVLNSNDEAKVLNRLYPGYQLSFHIPEPGKLTRLEVLKSPLDGYLFTLNNDTFEVEPIIRTPDVVTVLKESRLEDSLFMAGQRERIPAVTIMEMADIFGGVIDFMMDPRSGDDFSILYEEKYLDGEFVGHGAIIGAQFTNQGKQHIALRYEDNNGDVGYFNPEGESMRKAFLRNPLDVVRISSNFNLNRRHPILNTIRAHRGTDYAAPSGTPVRATSDGVVTFAARNGSFGKLIAIQHSNQFETKYAHLNDYASGIKKGSRVKQGQVIGFVGTTGRSTGPHLHYEILVNGVHKDWRAVVEQLPKAVSIESAEMPRFREQTINLLAQFQKRTIDNRILTRNNDINTNENTSD